MKTGPWVKSMISGVVVAIAACAVLLFAGCSFGALHREQCENGQERALGVLTALLTTVMGLAIKLDALDETEPKTYKRTQRNTRNTKATRS